MDILNYFVSTDGIITIVFIIWLSIVSIVVYKQVEINKTLLGGKQQRTIKEVVLEQMGKVGELHIEVSGVLQRFGEVSRAHNASVRKIGLVRFSAFEDTGGDQSFALALLDAENSGVLLCALHGRDRTRMYAKAVRHGEAAGHALSEEEQAAIAQALQSDA